MFGKLEGVLDTRVGYAGGKEKNPTYSDLFDHTEVVQVHYDPEILSYDKILTLFWKHGGLRKVRSCQYKSLCLWATDEQKEKYEESVRKLEAEGNVNTKAFAFGRLTSRKKSTKSLFVNWKR